MSGKMLNGAGWLAVISGVASLGLFAAAVYGFRFGNWPWPQAYSLATYAVWAGFAGLVAGALALVLRVRWRAGGLGITMLGIALSLPLSGLGAWFDISARLTPPINDISTDITDPPVFWFTVIPTDYPPANAAPQRAAYPDVQPLTLPMPMDAAFNAALALVQARGWQVLSADREAAQIEAIATSPLFAFQDEVALRLVPEGEETRIDMRSRSRLGQIDRGANARRIKTFLSDLAASETR